MEKNLIEKEINHKNTSSKIRYKLLQIKRQNYRNFRWLWMIEILDNCESSSCTQNHSQFLIS